VTDAAVAFRDELVGRGLLVATGVDGLYGRGEQFEAVVEAVDRLVVEAARADAPTVLRFPPVMPRWVFERTDYLRSFPNLTGAVQTFAGDDKAHAALLAELEGGGDWSTHLEPAGVVLCPAACHPLYPMLTGRQPEGGRYFDVYGYCFRHEPAIDPARMQAFRMHEIVYVGDPDGAQAHRDRWVDRGLELLGGLGLAVEAVVANDPFFGRVGRMLAANQRDEALKLEVVTPVVAEGPTAIMSANCHRDHFGIPFAIESSTGEVAHSACVGFGMERITLALLHTHGLDTAGWPAAVRSTLWP
jgi:seryl-tRNA synthetase